MAAGVAAAEVAAAAAVTDGSTATTVAATRPPHGDLPELASGWPGALGLGLLWRPRLAPLVADEATGDTIGFVEVIAESVGRPLPPKLDTLRRQGMTVVPHGVSLGLGGAHRPEPARLTRLASTVEACGAPLVSEHIAFVRAGGVEAGHLLSLPRTHDALDVLVENVREAVAALPARLALEPIATLVDWPGAEMTEVEFLSELLERVDVDLVLDVANMHVNAANRRRAGVGGPDADPCSLIEGLPLHRVAYVHAAGGRVIDDRHHDTHTDPLWPEVETLVEELWSRHEIGGLLLERDGHFPADDELRDELARLDAAATRGRARRHAGTTPAREANRPSAPDATHISSARQRLHVDQQTFVQAVTAAAPAPPGFDADDLQAVTAVLTHKRASTVTHAAPDVAALPRFADRFRPWAAIHPSNGCAACDAARFVRSLPPTDRTRRASAIALRAELDHTVRTRRGRPRPARLRLRAIRSPGTITLGIRLGKHRLVRHLPLRRP